MKIAIVLLVALPLTASAQTQTFDFQGFLTARGTNATGHPSWMRGGYGRFDAAGSPIRSKSENAIIGEAQLGFDWRPLSHLLVHAHGVARGEPSDIHGRRAGLVSAYVEGHWEGGRNELSLRAGQFFLGTSRENVGELWSSPYTINYSAVNAWVAQEVRPVGINAEWRLLTSTALITTSATAFRDNDTMGTLLAWRGWTIGNRLSVFDEVLPLPPLRALKTTFLRQRRDGTVPFERDLDGRTGYAARVRYAIPERGSVQVTHLDNRGDRHLYRHEYSWATKFDAIGADAHFGNTTLLGEGTWGRTAMGLPQFATVDSDFYAAYLLASRSFGRSRVSTRFDDFTTKDRRKNVPELYDEHGQAWTLSYFFDVTPKIRFGAEFTNLTGRHAEAEDSGFSASINGRSYIVELRYSIK